MKTYYGKSVFNGIAIGKISIYQKGEQQVKRVKVDNTENEKKRYYAAVEQATKELQALYDKAVKEVGEANAAIFEIHQMMLQDDDYKESVENIVDSQQVNAEYAVATTGDNFSQMFAAMDDEYMRGRAADVKDISERLLNILSGKAKTGMDTDEPVIVLADDLAPSETVQMNKELVLSFVTVHGSVNSHTAILARTMSIPALIGTDIPLDDTVNGKLAIVDGSKGVIYVEPDESTLSEMQEKQKEELEQKALLQTLKGKPNVTLDGKEIKLYANIGNIKDLATVIQNDAGGIGLFRSEFLYLEKDNYPTEEEQFKAYKEAVEGMDGKQVVVRTMDIGGDKDLPYLPLPEEENPFLGYRAIRISLDRQDIFRTQLRALLRASHYGRLAIMFPMIATVKEFKDAKAIFEEEKAKLVKEGIPVSDDIEVGMMMEIPAAAMIADKLAKYADFFSIGTNDLIQYSMAADRGNERVSYLYQPYNPSILRLIKNIIDASHKEGKWTGMCGEMAGDQVAVPLLLGLGLDEFSMSATSILKTRSLLKKLDSVKMQELAQKAVEDCETTEEVEALVAEYTK